MNHVIVNMKKKQKKLKYSNSAYCVLYFCPPFCPNLDIDYCMLYQSYLKINNVGYLQRSTVCSFFEIEDLIDLSNTDDEEKEQILKDLDQIVENLEKN